MVHGPRFTVHGPRSTVHGPRFTVHGPRFTVHGSRFTVLGPRFTVHGSGFKVYRLGFGVEGVVGSRAVTLVILLRGGECGQCDHDQSTGTAAVLWTTRPIQVSPFRFAR